MAFDPFVLFTGLCVLVVGFFVGLCAGITIHKSEQRALVKETLALLSDERDKLNMHINMHKDELFKAGKISQVMCSWRSASL